MGGVSKLMRTGRQAFGHQVGAMLLANWVEVEEEVEMHCHLWLWNSSKA